MQEIIVKNGLSNSFTLVKYPDGQRSVALKLDKLSKKSPIIVNCRVKEFSDFEILYSLMSALYKNDFQVEILKFTYLVGMRSDRAFNAGEPNYFRDVIAPVIKNLRGIYCIKKVYVLGPHNPHQLNFINAKMIEQPIYKKDQVFIGGDESVTNWCSELDGYFIKERLGDRIKVDLVHLDSIMRTDDDYKEIIVIDDLCDGGATFVREGEYLKQRFPKAKLKLFVIHGLFTQGVHSLLSYYDQIICTNSYQDIDHPQVSQIKVI